MKIPKRIANTVINSLKGGVVPRVGLPYIAVGRKNEINALLHDVDIIADGGASFRFVVGKYGSGKSFLLQTIRNYVMDRNFVVADADLSPERRLQGRKGEGLATYKELIRNLSTKTRPEGGALTLILDRWISNVQSEVVAAGTSVSDPTFPKEVEKRIYAVVSALQDMVHGFDFARLLTMYYQAFTEGNDMLKGHIVKWFRGEYVTKTEAKAELGVNIIISDEDWYEYLKLFALFLKKAGYSGMLVLIDELVNIYKVPNSITRQYNYEKILTMYNDALQGKASHIGIIMSGTPQCVEDTRRGIYSYEALRSRLAEGRFADETRRDMLAPVIRLEPLTHEEMLVLVEKLADIHAQLYEYTCSMTEEDFADFIRIEFERIGADAHITPREVIRDFIELLNIVYQHPETDIAQLLQSDDFSYTATALEEQTTENYAEFEI